MNVRIETKHSFRVAGIAGRGASDRGGSWVPPLWGAFAARSEALGPIMARPIRLWGLMSDMDHSFAPWGEEGLYLAGCEVDEGPLPEGFVAWTAPVRTYLVVAAAAADYGPAMEAMLFREFPARGYRLAGAIYEMYPNPDDSTALELWFPVVPMEGPARAIGGLPHVTYFVGDRPYLTPFVGSVWSIHRSLNGAESYADVLALSGAGNRLRWAGWDPSNVDVGQCCDDPFEIHRRVLWALGYRFELRQTKLLFGGQGPLTDRETARREIVDSIDRGMPVPALGVIGPPEGCAVAGYTCGGEALLGWNYFQADCGQPADRYFEKAGWYEDTGAYFLISRAEKPELTDAALSMLRAAASHARSGPVRGAAVGLDAWRAMLTQLENDDFTGIPVTAPGGPGAGDFFWADTLHGRFMVYCDALCQIHERGVAAACYDRLAEALPDWAEELTEAAVHMRKCAEYGGYLWNYLTMDEAGYEKFARPDIRKALADEGRRSMAEDEAAIAAIERLLAKIDGRNEQ